jgi:hypothetical protein
MMLNNSFKYAVLCFEFTLNIKNVIEITARKILAVCHFFVRHLSDIVKIQSFAEARNVFDIGRKLRVHVQFNRKL